MIPQSATVTDATACIGGSSLSLSKVFTNVNAVELDETRYTYLKHNMEALSLSNVHCFHGDALHICPTLEQDLIFLYPPWGGPEYKTQVKVSLKLSDLDLADVCIMLASHTQYIAIKVPVNFDENKFLQATHEHLTLEHKNTQLRKMHLLILRSGSWKTVGTVGSLSEHNRTS